MSFFLNSFNYAVIVSSVGSGFSILIDTTKAGTTTNTQFNLALASSTSYDFNIDWGDNVIESYTSSNTTGYTHTYPVSGTYLISIGERTVGGFPRVFYNSAGDRLKLLNITRFGGNQFGNNWSGSFDGCTNLQISATDYTTAKTQNITNFNSAWKNCTSLTAFPLIDTSKGTTFNSTWSNCNKLTSFPAINTLSGTTFFGAWSSCRSLSSFPLLDFTTPRIWQTLPGGDPFRSSFNGCTSLTSFDCKINCIPSIPTNVGFADGWSYCTSLTKMAAITAAGAFQRTWNQCTSLKSFDLPSILYVCGDEASGNLPSATFKNCYLLTNLPTLITSGTNALGYNASNDGTFTNCRSLTSFPFIDTSNVKWFYGTWQGCISLSASDFPTLDMSKMTDGTNCFDGVKLTTTSYSALLTALSATNINNTVTFHGGNSTFNTPGSAARAFLTRSTALGGRGWTITDGGYQAGT